MDTVDEAIKLRSAVADHGPLRSQNMPISIEGSVAVTLTSKSLEVGYGNMLEQKSVQISNLASLPLLGRCAQKTVFVKFA